MVENEQSDAVNCFVSALLLLEVDEIVDMPEDRYVELICTGCDFYDRDKERLECGAYQILVRLLRSGVVDRDDLLRALT